MRANLKLENILFIKSHLRGLASQGLSFELHHLCMVQQIIKNMSKSKNCHSGIILSVIYSIGHLNKDNIASLEKFIDDVVRIASIAFQTVRMTIE